MSGAAAADTLRAFCASNSVLDGDLEITETPLTDLTDLACLQSVAGSVTIEDNDALTNFGGLDWARALRRRGGVAGRRERPPGR